MSDNKKTTLSDVFRSPSTSSPAPSRSSGLDTTVITSQAEFKGALAFSGELRLDGRLEGTIEAEDGQLTIGEEAVVKAEISVKDVIIFGKVQGDITAQGRIEIKGKAQVYGDLHANRIMVEDGSIFVGNSKTLSGNDPKPEFSQIFSRLGNGATKANGYTSSSKSSAAE
jgi:cytoskeletal protein CcmA (bactofilin family)